jgi:acetolactate synthase-1/3 small subunit
MENKLFTLIVHSENVAGLLNQVTAVFTRLQVNIESLNVSASSIEGLHKYTITAYTEEENIEKIAKLIEKKVDVISAHYFTDDQIFSYEAALFKLSTTEFHAEPKVLKIISQYSANILEVNSVFIVLVKTGTSEEISALHNELQKYHVVLQFVRSGRVAVTTSYYEKVNEFLEKREDDYRSIHTNS